jgi:hypothetical protein
MNEQEARRAWQFVRGFDVPLLTSELLDQWAVLIRTMDVDQFQRAVRKSRWRPDNQLHMRPSIEAFRGYAGPPNGPQGSPYETPSTAAVRALRRLPHASTVSPREHIHNRIAAIRAVHDGIACFVPSAWPEEGRTSDTAELIGDHA